MNTPLLFHISNAFPASFSEICLSVLLEDDEIKWKLQLQADLAPRGNTWILETNAKKESVRFAMLARSFEERASQMLSDLKVIVNESSLVTQCFATKMFGQSSNAPSILPHIDNYQVFGHRPLIPHFTFVYYPLVKQCQGGELQIHESLDPTSPICQVVVPVQGDLVILAGNAPHSVSPLLAGERVSIVLNMYQRSSILSETILN